MIEWFNSESQKVIGFASTTLHDWIKNIKPKPMVTDSHWFSRVLC